MRATIFGYAVVVLLAAPIEPAISAEPAEIRELNKLVFEGIEAVAVEDIRTALKADFEVALAAHPDAPLAGYLRAVEATMLLGYLHSGFRDAKVTAEYDEPQERIVVRVEEGPRHYCGDVNITGLKQADKAALIEAVTQPPKPRTPWVKDRPAPFDESTHRQIRKRLTDAFAAQGFFSPRFDMLTHAEAGEKAATLEVTIDTEGPRAEIGQIILSGNERDADQEILNYLDLHSGQPYDSGLSERLKARLDESGRFLGAKIDRASPVRVFDHGREIVDLHIELRDYEPSQPIAKEFSAEEKALLKFRDWAHRWSGGETEYNIVVEGSFGPATIAQICADMDMPMPAIEQAGIARAEFKVVLSPKQGQSLRLRLFGARERLILDDFIAFSPDRLLIAAPQRNAKLDLPITQTQVTLNFKADTVKFDKLDESDRKFTLLGGATLNYRGKHEATPLTLKTHFVPAALFSFLHQEDSKCTLNNGVWHFTCGAFRAKFDAEDGRLLEDRLDAPESGEETSRAAGVSMRTEKAAFAAELRKIETQLAGAKAYDPAGGWKSILEFAIDEWLVASAEFDQAKEQRASWSAAGKLLRRWSPPPLAELWPETDADDQADDDSWFELPGEKRNWDLDDIKRLNSPGGRALAVVALGIYRRLAPTDGWLWPVGRDVILRMASPSMAPEENLRSISQSYSIGPVGELIITLAPTLGLTAAREGVQRLTVEGFRKDYQPLLSGDGWLSRWILSLAEAARSLDEAELRALPSLLDEGIVRELVANWLLILKEEPEKPVASAVSRMLDAVWNFGVRDIVAARLKKMAPDSPAKKAPGPWSMLNPDEVDRYSKTYGFNGPEQKKHQLAEPKLPGVNDWPIPETFNRLERTADELQKNAAPKSEKPTVGDETPISTRIKALSASESAPKSDNDSREKAWFEQAPPPRKPASPFPGTGDVETKSPSASDSQSSTTDTPVANQSDPTRGIPTLVAGSYEKKLGNAALAAFQPDDVVAKVGSKSILYRDVSPIVKMRLAPFLAKARSPWERQTMEAAYLDPLTKNVIDQLVFNKMLLLEFERSIPRKIRADPKKWLEADSKLQKAISKAFHDSLDSAREKVANASQDEIDQLLRQDGTVIRLALIMKEQHLESTDELDVALQQFGTTLGRQINDYGEYMMGIEAAKNKLTEKRVVSDKEMLEYYQERLADYYVPAKARFEILTAKFASFAGDRPAARDLASQMADEVMAGKPLADVARKLSQEPRAEEGGYYDGVNPGSLASAAIDRAVFSLQVGILSKVIEDDIGCHVIRVIERQEGSQLSFAEARPAILQTIEARNRKSDQQRFLSELRARTVVWTIYDDE